ncbi:MAG: L-threonylcarbamoyladenylate synthase [Candidatus Cryptobacteroides sp.]
METENIFKEEIGRTVEVLRNGGLILYPTDTVWGIGCDATSPEAVAKVFALKRRNDSKSLVLLADSLDMVCRYVKEVPEMAVQLVEVNDKPMTIIYPDAVCGQQPGADGALPPADRHCLAFNTVAEDGTVGIRIPMSDFCKALIRRLGRPLVSTSANISGGKTPLKFSEISEEIKSGVDYVVTPSAESGSTGKPSSIIKVGLDYTIQIIRE